MCVCVYVSDRERRIYAYVEREVEIKRKIHAYVCDRERETERDSEREI